MIISTERVKVIDRLRGLSIIYMLVTHMLVWVLKEESWWYFAAFPLTDIIGEPSFVFLSGASLVLSIRKQSESSGSTQHLRSLIILGLGILQNIVIQPFLPSIWGWNVLVAIGIFRIIGYYAAKLPAWVRGILVVAIIITTRPLLLALTKGVTFPGWPIDIWPQDLNGERILGYILFSFPNHNTLFPYFGFFLAGTIVADLLLLSPKDKQRSRQIIFLVLGIFLAALGIGLGVENWTNIDLGDCVLFYLNIGGRYPAQIPSILSRNSLEWSLTMLGGLFLLTLLFLVFEKRMYKNKVLTIFGEFSFTLYLTHGVVFAFAMNTWSSWFAFPVIILSLILVWYIYWNWWKRGNGIYSIEYWLNFATRMFLQYRQKRRSKKGIITEPPPTSEIIPIIESHPNPATAEDANPSPSTDVQ